MSPTDSCSMEQLELKPLFHREMSCISIRGYVNAEVARIIQDATIAALINAGISSILQRPLKCLKPPCPQSLNCQFPNCFVDNLLV